LPGVNEPNSIGLMRMLSPFLADGRAGAMRPAMRQLCFALLGLGASTLACAQIYAGQEGNGTVVLSNFRSQATSVVLVEAPPEPAAPLPAAAVSTPTAMPAPVAPPPALPVRYQSMIVAAAREHQVSPSLIAAVAAAESGFDARAVSPKGARGLMQLMPETARRFQVSNRFSPEQSVRGGAAYLRWLSDRFAGDLERVLAAYNAGEQAVERAGGIPPFAETQAYVPRVLRYLRHFAGLLGGKPV
jgi:soluble lytic murein transglycosylase-like protein